MAPEDDSTVTGYQFAAWTSLFATGFTLLIWVIIIRVSFESCTYREVIQAFGVYECHDWFVLVDILKLTVKFDNGQIFVDKPPPPP